MPTLVALDLPAGPSFVDAVRRVWDRGDAVAPLDRNAPAPHRDATLTALAPGAVIDDSGEHLLRSGRPVEPGDALVVTSSGTTGPPKAVVLTHTAVEHAAWASATALGVAGDTRWLACLPLHHVGGFTVLSRALVTGAGLVVHDGFESGAVDRAARDGATHVSLVPTALRRIHAELWRTILLGGSAIPADRPANSVATYGMTETCAGVVYEGLPLPGVGMRIAGPDPVGPIELRSPTLLRCYRLGDGTEVDPVGADGWLRTGDLGSIDAATGRLAVHGRADDLIITGGEKVWPQVVEAALEQMDAVAEVAVIGRADPEWGQRVVAVVVPVDPATPPTLEEVRSHVKLHLPPFAAPKELVLQASLPRTSLGKLRRNSLMP